MARSLLTHAFRALALTAVLALTGTGLTACSRPHDHNSDLSSCEVLARYAPKDGAGGDVGAAQEHPKRRCTRHVRHDSRSRRRHRAADDRRVNIPPKCSFRPRGIKSDELGRGPETAF